MRAFVNKIVVTKNLYHQSQAKQKPQGFEVYYLPHQRISSLVPVIFISEIPLKEGEHEEGYIVTIKKRTNAFHNDFTVIYIKRAKIRRATHDALVISMCYEKCMSSTYRRTGTLYIPNDGDTVIFSGSNGGRFHYTYSVFLAKNFKDNESMGEQFIHHRGSAGAYARAGIGISNETYDKDQFPSSAENVIR